LGANIAVPVLDISETGIRLMVKSALDKGNETEVSIAGYGQSRPVKLPADVVWAVQAADGTYCIGARFQKRLTYAELGHLTK
jgi:hypothetical protein